MLLWLKMLFCQTVKRIESGRRAIRFLAVLSYMTFLFAIETFSEGETVTDEVTWLPTITTKWSVILKNAIR